MSEKAFTVKEAAEFLGISIQTMYKILHKGEIEYLRVGRIKITEENLVEYKNKKTFGGFPQKDKIIG